MGRLVNYVARFFRGYDVFERMVKHENGRGVLMEVNKIGDGGSVLITNYRNLTPREERVVAKNPHFVCAESNLEECMPKEFASAMRQLRGSSRSELE